MHPSHLRPPQTAGQRCIRVLRPRVRYSTMLGLRAPLLGCRPSSRGHGAGNGRAPPTAGDIPEQGQQGGRDLAIRGHDPRVPWPVEPAIQGAEFPPRLDEHRPVPRPRPKTSGRAPRTRRSVLGRRRTGPAPPSRSAARRACIGQPRGSSAGWGWCRGSSSGIPWRTGHRRARTRRRPARAGCSGRRPTRARLRTGRRARGRRRHPQGLPTGTTARC